MANLTEDSRSLLGTPDAVGQWAIDSAGVTYRAQEPDEGSLTHNDWLPIRTHTIDFRNQVDENPVQLVDHVRLYAKGNDLFMVDTAGTASQITGIGGQESIYIRYQAANGVDGAEITTESWETVPFNENAGVAPQSSTPPGPYSWFLDQDFTTYPELTLAPGTYDYQYKICLFKTSVAAYIEVGARLFFSQALGGTYIEFSESLSWVGEDTGDNFEIGMVGQFTVPDPAEDRKLRLQIRTGTTQIDYGQAEPAFPVDQKEVYAYIKITKVS